MKETPNDNLTNSVRTLNGRPTIGFLTPHTGRDALGANVWLGVLKAAEEHNVNVICFVGEELRSHRGFLDQANVLYDLANSENIDGLVLWGSALRNFIGSEALNTFCERFSPLPIVDLDEIPKSVTESYDYRGMRLAIVHLIEVHGCRRVAFIPGAAGSSATQYRYQAYLDVLRAYNISFDPDIAAPSDYWDESSGRNAVCILLDQRRVTFEAIAAANDRLAIGAIEALQERSIRVPYDVAVVGFDNNPDGQYISPPLTTVPYPTDTMGQRAIRMLLAQINAEAIPEQIPIPANLVIRQSCGCSNPRVVQAGIGTVTKTEGMAETTLAARKDAILTAIEQYLEDHSWKEWAAQVLEAFLIELVRPSSKIFLSTLDDILSRVTAGGGNVAGWQNIISAMRRQVLSSLNDDAVRFRAEDLLGQARVLVGEIVRRNQGYQMLQTEQQTRTLHEISAKLISTFDVKELINVLIRELPRLNIPGCYLALYEDPETPTEWARLLLAYHEQQHIPLDPGGLRFPSRDLTPQVFLSRKKRFSMIVESLYFQQQQIGFVLFEVGPRDGKLYRILREQLSSALQGTLLVQQVQKHARELAQANAELARKQYILDAFMENVPDAIYFKDFDSRIIRANKAHARRVGVNNPAEEIGKTDFDFFTETEARLKYEQEQEIIRSGQPLIGIEEQQKRLDGHMHWSLTTKMPLRDEHGKIIGTFGISRDITTLKEAQASLERAYEEILTLNDQLKKEGLQYYLRASLLRTPFETSVTGIPAAVRETWKAPWLCIVLIKLLFSPSPAEHAQCSARKIMTCLRQLYEEYTHDISLSGMFNQITETEAILILNVEETSQIYTLCSFMESQSKATVQECASALVIGIGKEVTTLEDLHLSYDIAQQALFARQNTLVTQILTPIDAEQGKQEALLFSFPIEQESQLLASVIAGHTSRVLECLQQIIAQNMLEQSRYQKLVAVYDRCLRTLGKILAQHPIPTTDSQEALFLQLFRANKPETLPELQTRLLNTFRRITGYYHQYHKQRADVLLQKLLRYLEQHYTDSTLSLTSIAEAFKLTPSYISEYFKERSGINYVEYLAMLRITKAKELLVTHPDLKIYDIGVQVGFLNTETFIRTFKRIEGISPGTYRKQVLST
jgi:PAS domain S-box-containing protein